MEANSREDVIFQDEVVISGIIELNGLFSVLEKNSVRPRLINHQLNIKRENLGKHIKRFSSAITGGLTKLRMKSIS